MKLLELLEDKIGLTLHYDKLDNKPLEYDVQFIDLDDNRRSLNLRTRGIIVNNAAKVIEIELESIK